MISKIKSKLFKNAPSYSIEKLKIQISNLGKYHEIIAVCPQSTGLNWKGVNIATQSMFPNKWFQLPQYFSNQIVSDNDLKLLFAIFKDSGGRAIVYNGFPIYFEKVVQFSKEAGLKVGVVYSGGLSEFAGKASENISFGRILNLKKIGIIDEIAIMKIGLDSCIEDLTQQKIYRIHPYIHPIQAKKLDLDSKKIHIGVLSNPSFNKNRHNQVLAALSLENTIVHLIHDNEFSYLGMDERIKVHNDLDRVDFLSLVASMDLNLYISYSESWGQVITESISLGVPCLASDNSGIFEYCDTLKQELIVSEYDNPKSISIAIKRQLNNDIKKHFSIFAENLNNGANDLMNRFLSSLKT